MSNSILKSISKDASPSGEINTSTLVPRWQKMMESFFGCQVHVLAGVGYHPSEKGIQEYNMQLAQLMGEANPREQEELRVLSRDVWRKSLATAFNVGWEGDEKELDLIFAREVSPFFLSFSFVVHWHVKARESPAQPDYQSNPIHLKTLS